VFQHVLLSSLLLGWLALLFFTDTLDRLIVAFVLALIFWIAVLYTSEFFGKPATADELRAMLRYSVILGISTAPVSILLGCELVNEN